MAGNVQLAPLLVGLGVDELSMTPTALPQIRASLSQWSSQELSEMAERVLRIKTVSEVEELISELKSSNEKG
jgi:phosphoenolpyruvate-protein kinase (PTS system EI component)